MMETNSVLSNRGSSSLSADEIAVLLGYTDAAEMTAAIDSGGLEYAAITGSAPSWVLALPGSYTLTNGVSILTKWGTAPVAGDTLNLNSLGAKGLAKLGQEGATLISGGEIVVGTVYQLSYSSTNNCWIIAGAFVLQPGDVPNKTVVASTKTAAYTTSATDRYIRGNHATTSFTITLHAATGSGQVLTIKNIGAAAVTVDGNSSETIDGALTVVLAQYSSVTLVDAASGVWDIV